MKSKKKNYRNKINKKKIRTQKKKFKGGGIFFKSKKNKTIDKICTYSNLEEMNKNPRITDGYILDLCPNLTGKTEPKLFNLYNIPKFIFYDLPTSIFNLIKR